MLLRTATQFSIIIALALPLGRASADTFQDGIGTITPTASMSRNFVWTNTSSAPPEATVEIQFDGLIGSGVINLTSNYGFTVVNLTAASASATSCTASNPFAANATSGASVPPSHANSIPVTNPPSTSATVVPSGGPFTSPSSPSTTGDSPLGPSQSTNTSATTTSAFVGLFTGVGTRSRVSLAAILTWILVALIPTFVCWNDDF
ncbi:hypothetical protein HRR83_004050 [Exophiala dermatitidis]|uniref:Uncharacterized protein n=1 Tax=Exophiala dermatitidis TaxID=5970 RepID=A0AAN6EL76_EXODE|nr:hypothetical protein HRR73_007693 [Exophiala dermatitidis]KAJ4521647.1 hypothetical protein HRR74_003472 [Exophiala dermatitidis]KAJ4531777.1 hypothetical protein HRR77_009186 [Exophiala dermatitidis]KAJ4545068.1 hypothetical protein HRR76_003098 [Exophiala dermatitidis]KAJ4554690.1 hypothetical protein HRR79_009404 [Exophiala dermatitidis]